MLFEVKISECYSLYYLQMYKVMRNAYIEDHKRKAGIAKELLFHTYNTAFKKNMHF